MSNPEYTPPHGGEVLHTSSLTIHIDELESGQIHYHIDPDEVGKASELLTGYEMAALGAPLPHLGIRVLTVLLANDWISKSLQMAADLIQKQKEDSLAAGTGARALVPVEDVVVH